MGKKKPHVNMKKKKIPLEVLDTVPTATGHLGTMRHKEN